MSGERTTNAPLVLIVEDEPQVLRLLRTSLPVQGFRVLESETGKQALALAAQYVPDLVLLDLGLPDIDGIEVTTRLREWSDMPIIVLSARGQERNKVEALDAGADDYLTKPFGFAELLARMRVALRHSSRGPAHDVQGVFECGPLSLDVDARRVRVDGADVHLTPIEYKLLTTLARHAGKVVTHKQLLTEVWGPKSTNETHYLRVYMTHLRRKLEPGDSRARILATEAGVGYRLQCPEP